LHFLAALILFSITAVAQSEIFAGTWQIRKSPITGKINLSVNIVQQGETLSGTVVFVNPDGTTFQLPIAKTELKGDTLDFQTLDRDATMHWHLTVARDARQGVLKGSDHEMLIEEKVTKKR
jgi:hypothetical protein